MLRDEETLAPRFSLRVTRALGLVAASIVLIACFFIAGGFYQLIDYFKAKQSSQADLNRKILTLSMSIDSLAEAIQARDQYIDNLRNVLQGRPPLQPPATKPKESNITVQEVRQISPEDSAFRKQFELETLSLASRNEKQIRMSHTVLFPPLRGVLLGKFEPERRHFGIDIVARKNEPIKAIADGTVIIASWTQDSGYTIGIQHKNEMISFYKHNSTLLRKLGDVVKAGDVIAIIGNSGELTDGPHLHFELWLNGRPVNPENYIVF